MDLLEMKQQVMFQTNNDAEDLGDFQPHLTDYLNDGYDRLAAAFAGEHVTEDSQTFPPLRHDRSRPELPEWAHRAIADWATWMVYRNGSAPKQSRGYAFRAAFETVEKKLRGMTAEQKGSAGAAKTGRYFENIPL